MPKCGVPDVASLHPGYDPERSTLRLLMHAVLHVVAAFEKVDGRVFLLGLCLALGLKLGHSRALLLGGGRGRHGKRAGQQASRNDGDYGFHGSSSSRRKLMRQGAPEFRNRFLTICSGNKNKPRTAGAALFEPRFRLVTEFPAKRVYARP